MHAKSKVDKQKETNGVVDFYRLKCKWNNFLEFYWLLKQNDSK